MLCQLAFAQDCGVIGFVIPDALEAKMHDYDPDQSAYDEFLGQLVEGGDIGDPVAEGITKKVIADGEASLTSKQKYVFNAKVKDRFPRLVCSLGGEEVEWDFTYDQLGSDEPLCSYCSYKVEKLKDE